MEEGARMIKIAMREDRVRTDCIERECGGYRFKIDVRKLVPVLRDAVRRFPFGKSVDKILNIFQSLSVEIKLQETIHIPGMLGTQVEVTGLYSKSYEGKIGLYRIEISLQRLLSSDEPHSEFFAYILAHELWHWIQELVPGHTNLFSEILFGIRETFCVLVHVVLFVMCCIGTIFFWRSKWSYPLRSRIDRAITRLLYVYLSPSEREAYRFADKIMQGHKSSDWKDVVSIEKISRERSD